MSELIIINDIFDQLKHENNRLLNELLFAQKNIQLLENFRDFSLKFSSKCICDQNIDYEKQLNGLENNYQIFMNENNKCINNNTISIKSEIIDETLLSNDINLSQKTNDESIEKYITEDSLNRETKSKSKLTKNRINKNVENTDKQFDSQQIGCEKSFKTKNYLRDHEKCHKKKVLRIFYPKNVILDTIRAGNIQTEKVGENIKAFRKINEKTGSYNIFGFGCDWNDCQYISGRKDCVLTHIQSEHTFENTDKPFVCQWIGCEKRFKTKNYLRDHERHHKKKMISIYYPKKYILDTIKSGNIQIEKFGQNIKAFRKVSEKTGFNHIFGFGCDWNDCEYVSCKKSQILSHIRSEHTFEKPFVCTECDFKTTNKGFLRNHIRISHETKDKKFKCDFDNCDYQTKLLGSLQVHQKIHSGQRPYACDWPGCEFRSITKGSLETHYKTHSNGKPYVCDWPECEAAFRNNSSLRMHKKSHLGEKQYLCDWPECGKTFMHEQYLKLHHNIHTGEKKYLCSWPGCGRNFKQYSVLREHLRVHKNDKSVKCMAEGCDKTFIQRGNMRKHYRRMHTNKV